MIIAVDFDDTLFKYVPPSDVDNPYIMQAINLPSVMRVILANAEMLKREADIAACRKAIEESQAKEAAARKHLESMGVIV